MNTRGGDFFGQGSYGCTFAPPPTCVNEVSVSKKAKGIRGKKLGKVFDSQAAVDQEWKIAEVMSRVDPNQEFFLYPVSKCTTSLADVKKDSEALSCSYTHRTRPTSLAMLIMKKGGEPLVDYIYRSRTNIPKFVEIMIPVMQGLQKLARHGLVHHDLKFDNILYNATEKDTKIIDFGLMVRKIEAFDWSKNLYLFSDYWLHPPEYRILQYVSSGTLLTTTKDDARRIFQKNMHLLNTRFSSNDRYTLHDYILSQVFTYCDYEKEFVDYMLDVCKKETREGAVAFMAKHAGKIDMYSLGITMAYLSMYLHTANDGQHIQVMYKELLQGLLHPDPRKRMSPSKALSHATAILAASKRGI
jgi:serine/threonine protein kinase